MLDFNILIILNLDVGTTTSMKFRHACLLSLLCTAMIPMKASSQTMFMVQLGTFESEEQASAHWKKMTQTFPEEFESLRYTPNEIMMRPDNFVSYRTQAGPIPSREEAEELCSKIMTRGHECYVAETAMFTTDDSDMGTGKEQKIAFDEDAVTAEAVPPTSDADTPKAAPTPQVATNYVASASPDESAQQFPASASTNVPNAPVASSPTIAVEEAIPVPLSEDGASANPYIERGNRLADAHPNDSSRLSSLWAEIAFFKNAQAAAQYVRLLKSRDRMLPPKLRIRMTRPFGNRGNQQLISLRIGPFMTTRPIRRICALTLPEKMRCRGIKDLGGSVRYEKGYATRAQAAQNRHAVSREQAYVNRRRAAMASRGTASPYAGMGGSYFVQLGSFMSPRAADEKWNELATNHSGILRTTRKDVMAPNRGNNSGSLFRLRAGPFKDHNTASYMCNSLKAQGTLCIVVK
ncbi:MAG: hypothetical protein EAY65_05395 [Alphaproteobacteria bacterium]|nr:MAG: hypothetical protein EAY65_05395 [Alphaproteobacteria bacterium]